MEPEPAPVASGDLLPRLWTLEEVAAETRLSYWWLRRSCARREIEFTKAGKHYKMTAAQVAMAIEAAKMPATARRLPAPPEVSQPAMPPMDASVPMGLEDLRDEINRERKRRLAGRRRG
ncbi:hypothetical protein [Dactylosporangium sp. NPDC051484]|uniref:hypothetical protein n=1 Tax=Dactylosporangium sp. NPDC051484 TaxID=3154942 RepID=UPI00344E95EA